jgi:sec-independent protein translocase protein TatC
MGEDKPRTMTFLEHLQELRRRLWWGIVFVALGIVAAYVFRQDLMALMLEPFKTAWDQVKLQGGALPEEPMIHYKNMAEPFFTDLKLAFLGGLYVGLPLLATQIWLFVAPGLLPKERRYAIPFLGFAYLFFSGGVVFCYVVVLPMAYQFFFKYAEGMNPGVAVNPTVMINDYVTFSMKLLAAFGCAFELPLFVAFLTMLRLVDWRQLIKYMRWAMLGTFVVGAMLTPPDPASQLMMAVPLLALYLLSICLSFFLWPRGHANRLPWKKRPKKKAKSEKKSEKKKG